MPSGKETRMSTAPYFPPLVLGISSRLYRMNDANATAAAEEFDNELHGQVLRRDKFRCGGCGIVTVAGDAPSGHGLEVHHIDFDHHNNEISNLISLCPLCHGILHLGNAARRPIGRTMRVVWLPWITQEECNLLSWVLAVAIYRGSQNRDNPDNNETADKAGNLAELLAQSINFPSDYILGNSAAFEAFKKSILLPSESGQPSRTPPAALLATLLGSIRSQDAKLYDLRQNWLGGLRIFFDPRKPELFVSSHDSPVALVPGMSASGPWLPGDAWADTWLKVSKQFDL